MPKKCFSVMVAICLLFSTAFLGCDNKGYDAPISCKTYDIKSFSIEDGKKVPIDPIFSKTVFEYEKEAEDKIDFVEWQPKPLTAKGELEVSWVRNNYFDYSDNELLLKNYNSFLNFDQYCCESKIDGWQIEMFDNQKYLIDPFSGDIRQAEDYGDYDSINGISIDLNLFGKVYRCRDRKTKEIISMRGYYVEDGIPFLLSNQLFLHSGQHDILSERSISDFRKYWFLKNKTTNQSLGKFYIVEKSKNILWFILVDYLSDKTKKMFYVYNLKKEIAYELIVSDIIDIFSNQDSLFLINSSYKVYNFDIDSLEFSCLTDLSKMLMKNVENDYYCTSIVNDMAIFQFKNNKLLLNLKTKKIFQTDLLLGINNNYLYLYDDLNNNVWGFDQNTFEKTWHINTSDYSKNNKVVLVDERGVLIQDKDMLYAFLPKK